MNGGARINLEDAWPISDEEGRNLTGYTFTIENKCEDSVNYIIALESLESSKGLEYLNNNYVKLAIDDEIEKKYGSLDIIDNVVLENDTETIRETREVTTSTVQGNSINEHTIRIWLSEDAPLTEQNKVFTSRVRITGGQGVENTNVPSTADACFTIDENGEILGYDESCGTSVVIPARVNGTQVKTIDSDAFRPEKQAFKYYDSSFTEIESFDETLADAAIVQSSFSDPDNGEQLYFIVYATDQELKNAITKEITSEFSEPIYYADEDEIPSLNMDEAIMFFKAVNNSVINEGEPLGIKHLTSDKSLVVSSLNLSKAIYLEKIENFAFTNAVNTTQEEVESVEIGLTELILPNTDQQIQLGNSAFLKSSIENLETFTNLVVLNDSETFGDNFEFSDETSFLSPFAYSIIENLTISSTANTNEIYADEYPSLFEGSTIYLYTTITNLTINEGIKSVPQSTFINSKIKELTLSDGVELIEGAAFSGCGIETINWPNSLRLIDVTAFSMNNITKLDLPEGFTTIGVNAFAGNSELVAINLPSTIAEIGENAFKNVTATITFNGRSDLVGLTLGDNWKGNSTYKFNP